ncbi:dihydrofolate reductase family protein [Cellulosimicrobium cellulans]|uniref:dihydrofolate reductase family protein n=1 Tax=Cellulosimicrobium cellulans TaxID=1710 RepID=UPI0019662085|nr:dihydrofolate reductase family protein [Cellulosimicrobium cellulans]MBN0042268.1 dihydrofolate reductase family protein [Cellulosimicrobium cellulans]
MTTFHAFLGCSLDGYIAGPNGELDWLTSFDNTGYEDFFGSVQAMAMGRGTYEVMLESAPDYYRGMPIHVLSSTLAAGARPEMGRSPVQVHRDIPSLQASLEEAGIERVYADGGRAVQAFLAAGRLADLTVTRVPVLLGEGIPLFGPLAGAVQAQLVASHVTDQGAVQSVYRFPTR